MISDITIFGGPINYQDVGPGKVQFDVLGVAIIFDNSSLIISASLSTEGDNYPLDGSFVLELSNRELDVCEAFKKLSSLHGLPYASEASTSLYEMFSDLGSSIKGDLSLSILNGRNAALSLSHFNGLVQIRYERPLNLTMSVALKSVAQS